MTKTPPKAPKKPAPVKTGSAAKEPKKGTKFGSAGKC